MKNLIVKTPSLKHPHLKMNSNFIAELTAGLKGSNLITQKTGRDREKSLTAGRGGKHYGKTSAMGAMALYGVQ